MKVLICDKLPEQCSEIIRNAGLEPVVKTDMTPEQLKANIGQYDGVIVRSSTRITADALSAAGRLRVVCRAGVGVDNVDVVAASKKGVVVMNTPGGNTVSTAEHTVAMLLALTRSIRQAANSVKEGKWDRKKFTGTQLAGKTLGVVGLGRVGFEVARRAAAFEMRVLAYDPYITTEKAAQCQASLVKRLDDLYRQSDYITLHTPLTDDTRGLVGKRAFGLMKKGVRIINCARGELIDEEALHDAIVNGTVAGAALDVFEQEPPTNKKLLALEQVLPTPHLGASTEEAQVAVALDAARQTVDALLGKGIRHAVNLPAMDLEELEQIRPYLVMAEKMGILEAQLMQGGVRAVDVTYSGDVAKQRVALITSSLLAGLLKPVLAEDVNVVNAPILAKERGIRVNETKSSATEDFTTLVTAVVRTESESRSVAGTVLGKREMRIVRIDGYDVEAIPEGNLLVVFALDKPGLIGNLGTLLGREGINIARMTFGRQEVGGKAITVLNLDGRVTKGLVESVGRVEYVESVRHVSF